MLKGLKAVEFDASFVFNQRDLRMESDYWLQKRTSQGRTLSGELITEFVQYGTSSELNEVNEGYPVLRLNEFDSMFIGKPSKYCDKIDEAEYESLRLLKGDVLICRTNGNPNLVGKSAIVPYDTNYAYASYLFKIRPKHNLITSEALVAFLNGKYGRREIDKYSMQGNQTNFSPAKFREIDIPILSKAINERISENFKLAYKALKKSQTAYMQAEELLLQNIGLSNFNATSANTNIIKLTSSFGKTGRLDAEYYLPKYAEIENKIKSQGEWDTLGSLILKIDTGEYAPHYYKKGEKDGLAFYIRSTNIKGGQIEDDDSFYVNKVDHVRIAEAGDIMTARVGSVGIFGVVDNEFDGSVYSDNVLSFRFPKAFNPDVYVLLFNTPYYFDLIDRLARGSVQQRLNQETLKELPIPILNHSIQKQVGLLIHKSFSLKRQSKELINKTKLAVEMCIEQGEAKALKTLK